MPPPPLALFAALITLQFIVIVSHDLLHIPGWTHGRQVRAAIGAKKFWLGTLINAVFPGLACCYALQFRQAPVPGYAANYWVIYTAVTVLSAIGMWWVPYFRGAKEETKQLYAAMYAGTIQVLPARGENPRPNLLHLFFHALFLLNLALAAWVWWRAR